MFINIIYMFDTIFLMFSKNRDSIENKNAAKDFFFNFSEHL